MSIATFSLSALKALLPLYTKIDVKTTDTYVLIDVFRKKKHIVRYWVRLDEKDTFPKLQAIDEAASCIIQMLFSAGYEDCEEIKTLLEPPL